MSTATTSAEPAPSACKAKALALDGAGLAPDHSFLLRRLHSLSGIVPIGVFLVEHLFSNAYALRGPAAYNRQVEFLVGLPFVVVVETIFIFIPILFHALYGVYIWWQGESNVSGYPWTGNWLYALQRVSGLITFVYIPFHVWEQRFSGISIAHHPELAYGKVVESLSNPLVAGFYFVGITAACFHFAYGLWLFGCKWGLTPGPRAQRFTAALCGLVGLALLSMGWLSLGKFVLAP